MLKAKTRTFIVIKMVLLIFACNNRSPSGEQLKLSAQTSQATVTIQLEDVMRPVVDITSRTGIGSATLVKENGQWPDKLEIRLHTNGLEHFFLATDHLEATFAITSTEPHRVSKSVKQRDETVPVDKAENLLQQVAIEAVNSDGNQAMTIPLKSGWFRISVPGELLFTGNDTLRINWIDFYR